MEGLKEYEELRSKKLEYLEVIDNEGHVNITERAFQEANVHLNERYDFLYKHETFVIVPLVIG